LAQSNRDLLAATGSQGKSRGTHSPPMNDLIFVTASVAFFVLSAAYAVFCEKAR
jgi:hypothetical protein